MRAAQISQNQSNLNRIPPQMPPPAQATILSPIPAATVNPALMDIDHSAPKNEIHGLPSTAMSPENSPNLMTIDPRIQQQQQQMSSPIKKSSPMSSHTSVVDYTDKLDDFFMTPSHFMQDPLALSTPDFQDTNAFVWSEYPVDFDTYGANLPIQQGHIPAMPAFPDLSDISSTSEHMSSSRGSVHTRSTSIMSTGDFDSSARPIDMTPTTPTTSTIPEREVIIASEASWPLARCNPPVYSGLCPKTAIVHLESLEKCRHETTWKSLDHSLNEFDWDATDLALVVPMADHTRDEMLAMTQGFLNKALKIHRGGVNGHNNSSARTGSFGYFVLPSAKILEYFLRSYVRNLSFFYSLVMTGSVDPNEMVQNPASALLVLLMIAQGASAVPTAEARALSVGLIETCRISLFDIIERDVEMSADPTALRCALLFTLLGAWSGDKWLMDIAMGQRGMYLSMLRHAGMFESPPPMLPPPDNLELQWRSWLNRESQNRLVYNFVMVDQELALFHDTATMLTINDLCCSLPGPELLWMSGSAEQWSAGLQTIYDGATNVNPQLLTDTSMTPSLSMLFQEFLREDLSKRSGTLTSHQLRLLLHPLQAYLYSVKQTMPLVPDTKDGPLTKDKFQDRLSEAQTLLQKWYELTVNYYNANPNCPTSRTNLVLYHLISLNAVTDFPQIEKIARRGGPFWDPSSRHQECIPQREREEAVFRCGQVYRLIRSMPQDRRPSWWSAAIYRVSLILWMDCVSRTSTSFPQSDLPGNIVAIDQLTPEDPRLFQFMWKKEGVPALTQRDGTRVLSAPSDVLEYAVSALDEGHSTKLGDGIKRKLIELGRNWQTNDSTHSDPQTSVI